MAPPDGVGESAPSSLLRDLAGAGLAAALSLVVAATVLHLGAPFGLDSQDFPVVSNTASSC